MKNFAQNLRQDLPASIIVFFVALPLCLGIALASGAPLFSGIIAGIVGGIMVGAASGSNLGVSGPAAGLAVIVLGYISSLGSWENFLAALAVAGIIQIIMGYLRLGSIGYYFPSSVIKGMLSGIGILIIIKQLPRAFGYASGIEADLDEVMNQSDYDTFETIFSHINLSAVLISMVSLVIFVLWEIPAIKRQKFFKIVQAPLMVIFVGIFLHNFISLAPEQLVQIPSSTGFAGFFNQLSQPNFAALANPKIYFAALTLAAVASIESLLCVEATDKIDPHKRITPTNRELKAQGLGNLFSGLIGGLPITQVIVRSSANISFGAKSKLSAILHGFWLFIAVISFPQVLNMIPLASLAAILLSVGYKLAHPTIFRNIYRLGMEHFAPFATTIAGMVAFDLLTGVGLGIAVSIGFVLYHNFRNSHEVIKEKEGANHQHIITLAQEVSFLNKGAIIKMLEQIPANSKVVIDGSKSKVIDYDVIEIIRNFQVSAHEKKIEVSTRGIDVRKSR